MTITGAVDAPLSPLSALDADEFGIVFSHASELTGGLVEDGFTSVAAAAVRLNSVLDAQPGIEAVLVYRHPDGRWTDPIGRSPREIIQHDWAASRVTLPTVHVSRSFGGADSFTATCPCQKAVCGFAIPSSDCTEHSLQSAKTIRGVHDEENCLVSL